MPQSENAHPTRAVDGPSSPAIPVTSAVAGAAAPAGTTPESIALLHAAFAGVKLARPKAELRRTLGPQQSVAQRLFNLSQGGYRYTTATEASKPINAALTGPVNLPDLPGTVEVAAEVPPLFLLIPWDHEQNCRDDSHTDFEQLRAKGQIRDRAGEVIEIKSVWHAWGAYRMDRFFQSYCKVAKAAFARGEPFPSDSVRDWVRDEAARLGMPLEKAHAIIRDGCGGSSLVPNSMWWRAASLAPKSE